MERREDPDWPRQAASAVAHDVREFLRTIWAVARTPAAFAREWAAGERQAMNPIFCLLNALAVIGPWHVLWAGLLGVDTQAPLLVQLAKPALPIVAALFLGGGVHLVLRLGGAKRRWRTSLGLVLFVQAGPIAVLGMAVRPLASLMMLGRGGVTAPLGNFAVVVAFCVYLVATMAGAHGISRKRSTVAVVAVFLLWIVFWGVANRAAPGFVRALIT